jgi:hypothetical protein
MGSVSSTFLVAAACTARRLATRRHARLRRCRWCWARTCSSRVMMRRRRRSRQHQQLQQRQQVATARTAATTPCCWRRSVLPWQLQLLAPAPQRQPAAARHGGPLRLLQPRHSRARLVALLLLLLQRQQLLMTTATSKWCTSTLAWLARFGRPGEACSCLGECCPAWLLGGVEATRQPPTHPLLPPAPRPLCTTTATLRSLPGPEPTPTTRLRLVHSASRLVAHLSAMTVVQGGMELYEDKVCHVCAGWRKCIDCVGPRACQGMLCARAAVMRYPRLIPIHTYTTTPLTAGVKAGP